MFERDYFMRIINDLARFLARVLLNKDTVTYELSDIESYMQTDYLHKQLLSMIELGEINEAEDLLHTEFDTRNRRYLELAIDFYSRLNELDDEFLEKNNFSREEIEQGLKAIAGRFGMKI